MAVLIFVVAQLWAAVDLVCAWRLRMRQSRLLEDIARKALENPSDENLRTLMLDVASTHSEELGSRLPVRLRLKHSGADAKPHPEDEGSVG